MPCYIPPEYIQIQLGDLKQERREELLSIFPEMTDDTVLASIEYDPAIDLNDALFKAGIVEVADTATIDQLLNGQIYYDPINETRVNGGGIYAYDDPEGLCDYRVFHIGVAHLHFIDAWVNEDKTLRYAEEPNDDNQFMRADLNTVGPMNITQLHEYMLEAYEQYMDQGHDNPPAFIVFDTSQTPSEVFAEEMNPTPPPELEQTL